MFQSVGGGLLITPLPNTVLSRIAPETAGMASGVLSTDGLAHDATGELTSSACAN
ncbi:hypothetical protein ACFXPW_19400 [Streptomyces goshikiensis]|uniref:hypothetical protein n=1 Tax=Streptomyces goshikiensis TaxID=1942 RepID=UPI00369E20B8